MSGVEEQARSWTHGRQRLNRAGADAREVLRAVVGVYSAHPTAPLSLLARCDPFGADAFRTLDAVRLPAMRGSIHLLPHETAHLAFRAVPEPASRSAERLDYFGLGDAEYAQLRATILAEATEPRSARELRAATGAVKTLAPVLAAMTRAGELLRVGAHGLRSNELLYVAGRVPDADADQALAWLAGKYLRAFGPARREDFAWWAGVPSARADAALAAVDTEELDDGLLLRAVDVESLARAAPLSGTVDLLPKWDAYTMGYPAGGRGRFADADVAADLYEASGDSRPMVLVDGLAAGTWGVRTGGGLELELDLFDAPGPVLRRALDERAGAIRTLLS